jgi:hypothetical protein
VVLDKILGEGKVLIAKGRVDHGRGFGSMSHCLGEGDIRWERRRREDLLDGFDLTALLHV